MKTERRIIHYYLLPDNIIHNINKTNILYRLTEQHCTTKKKETSQFLQQKYI